MSEYKNKTIEELNAQKKILDERLTYARGKAVPLYEMKKKATEMLETVEREDAEICSQLQKINAILDYEKAKSAE